MRGTRDYFVVVKNCAFVDLNNSSEGDTIATIFWGCMCFSVYVEFYFVGLLICADMVSRFQTLFAILLCTCSIRILKIH